MSFDENQGTNIPMTVPDSGTVLVSGLGDNPVEAEATMMQLASQAVRQMEDAFISQIKEMGL